MSEFCGQAELVVKTDDDQFADLYEVKISYIVCITGLETRQLQVFVFLEQARTLKQRQILTLDQYSHYTLTSSSPGPFKVQGQSLD